MSVKQTKAIIFDYDGLLVDTEDVWFRACVKVCAGYGIVIGEEYREELMISRLSSYLVKRFNLPTTKEVLRPRLYGAFDELTADGIHLLDGAVGAIERLSIAYPLAVGTGSNTAQVEVALDNLSLRSYFRAVVGADQVAHGKPAPDIYLKAASKLGVKPSHCIAIEDQPRGIKAAKAAGMLCIAVPNIYLTVADFSQADIVIEDLNLLDLTLVEGLQR